MFSGHLRFMFHFHALDQRLALYFSQAFESNNYVNHLRDFDSNDVKIRSNENNHAEWKTTGKNDREKADIDCFE